MPIRTRKIDPPFTNPFPPTLELIIEFVKKCHNPDEEVEVDIRQLSGGLSRAIVAIVNHSGQRHVVKIDRQELVIKEISTYQENLSNVVDNSQEAKTKMALLDFPSANIRQKGMDELICKKGYDNEEYAIHCYSYAKEDVAQESLWSFDAWINENVVSPNASNSMSDLNSLVSDLCYTLHKYFYDRGTEKRNFRKFFTPNYIN